MTAPKKAVAKKTAPKNRAAEISAARKAAFHILLAVERGQSHSDDLLRSNAVNALSAADRNLATALVLGVLRWQILLDRQIHALLTRPGAKLDVEILIALRLGAFQLQRMDRIPARAAIDESVELAKQAGHRFASSMVNAVLRKLSRAQQFEVKDSALKDSSLIDSSLEDSALEDSALKDSALEDSSLKGHGFSRAASGSINERALAPEGSFSDDQQAHPAWMVERWTNFFGPQATRAICRHGQSQPSLTVRLAAPNVEAELTSAGITLVVGELLSAARTVVFGDVTATAAFREGRVRLQDEGSQLVAEILASNLNQDEKSILDACAAPGGKTLILAERNPNARIVALESSAPRMEQLKKRLAPHGDRIECRLADAAAFAEEAGYDLALADVPCSGTGTLGRNPEIRHRLRVVELPRQAERQRAILTAALRALRPGGRAVYSTCSLEPEENEEVVAAVLAATPFARLLPLADHIEALRFKGILTENGTKRLQASFTPEGCLRLLPGAFHTDGFFVALIERIA
jgi:16S rRNA (cytosine967-C5)-methyltransferase